MSHHLGEDSSFLQLKEFFLFGKNEEERKWVAIVLANQYPQEGWELFVRSIRKDRFLESIEGLKVLGGERSVFLIVKLFYERGNRMEDLKILLSSLVSLEAVDALCMLVNDPFIVSNVRFIILQALSAFNRERVIKLFLGELNISNLARQELAILTLGRWKIAESAGVLCRRLREQITTSLRRPIIYALANIATNEALVGIQELLFHKNKDLRLETAEQIAQFPNRDFLPLLHACLATFHREERGFTLVQEAIDSLENELEDEFQKKVQPWIEEFESILF